MRTYRFILPDGREQRTDTQNPELIAMIDAAVAAHKMDVDPFGRLIVTNEFLFYELMKQIQEVLDHE